MLSPRRAPNLGKMRRRTCLHLIPFPDTGDVLLSGPLHDKPSFGICRTTPPTCPKYLADKKDGKVKGIFDIHVIDVYLTNARSSAWVFDTGSVAHICNSKQGLQIKRRLAKDEVTMRVGNGSKAM